MIVVKYKRIVEMETLVDLVSRVTQKSTKYDVPKYYSNFMGYTIVYKFNYNDSGLLVDNFDSCEKMLVENYKYLSSTILEDIKNKEMIIDGLYNKMLEFNEKLPKECLSYIARNYVYDSDLGNTCLTDINFESYAKALIMECEDKFLNKGPVRKLKDYFSKRKRRLEYE